MILELQAQKKFIKHEEDICVGYNILHSQNMLKYVRLEK